MKRWIAICALTFGTYMSIPALAQNHGEVGVFADYTRVAALPQDELGVGARVSVNFRAHMALEADGSYDFERTRIQVDTPSPGISNTSRSSLRLTSLLFGPKFQLGTKGPFRAFVFAKGGVLRFGTNRGPATFGNAGVLDFGRNGDYNGAFYPGGGIEAFIGPIGLRLDIGDEIYFDNGANSNLKITFGPHIRF